MVNIEDIIAIILIAGGLTAKCLGYNNIIDTILIAVASFYFGTKVKHGDKT